MTFLALLAGAVFGYTVIAFLPHEAADEGFHGPEIWNFYSGNYRLEPTLAMLPTYHFVLAQMARLLRHYDVDLLRFLSACVALLCLPVFGAIVRHHRTRAEAEIKTVQLLFLPFAFPFFFLLYTDMWSLLAILATLLCALKRRHVLAGLCGLLAVSLRQTAILWVGFVFVLVALEQCDTRATFTLRRALRNALRRGWPHLVVAGLFAVFVVLNKGIAVGDRSVQAVSVNPTIVYVFLICAWALFLPYNLGKAREVLGLLRRPWVAGLVALGFPLYLATYRVTHQYNAPGLDFYLHNRLLTLMTRSTPWRVALYVPLFWMTLSLCTLRFPEPRLRLLLVFIPLSLCVHPFVEERYYLPALAVLLAFREARFRRLEVATVAAYIPVSAYLALSIAKMRFFP
jgi:alpha-1,2-glucosyltransferase